MKIVQSQINLASEHTASKGVSRSEVLRMWVGDQRPDFEGQNNRGAAAPAESARVSISEAARQAALAAAEQPQQDAAAGSAAPAKSAEAVDNAVEETMNDPKLRLLVKLIEALTGAKVQLMDGSGIARAMAEQPAPPPDASGDTAEAPHGWGVEYEFHEEIHEQESTRFRAQGEVITADGKRLQFDLSLHMSREFRQSTHVSFQAGDAVRKDPLVINFDGNAAELTDQKFDFDIDADGEADRISFVGSASGFLALDRNANGSIDDGTELFGARTGNGFAELAAYDEDGNGWIDEADSVFAQLRIWTKDADGTDRLTSLAERNVGALYLGQTATPFDLKNAQNRQHGQILSTGVYLSEDGRAGTVQQLDLFV